MITDLISTLTQDFVWMRMFFFSFGCLWILRMAKHLVFTIPRDFFKSVEVGTWIGLAFVMFPLVSLPGVLFIVVSLL